MQVLTFDLTKYRSSLFLLLIFYKPDHHFFIFLVHLHKVNTPAILIPQPHLGIWQYIAALFYNPTCYISYSKGNRRIAVALCNYTVVRPCLRNK